MTGPVFDAAALTAHRARMWTAVDQLTRPSTHTVHRDDGTITFAGVASLWQQSTEVLTGGTRSPMSASNPSERAPVDLTLMTFRGVISGTTRAALLRRRVPPRHGVPAQIRQLAAHAVTHDPGQVWAHADRFARWARQLGDYLTAEHPTVAVRIRDSACPRCHARQVVIDLADGPVVASALVVDFHQGFVRSATCGACGGTWWRGQQLEDLATDLGCAPIH